MDANIEHLQQLGAKSMTNHNDISCMVDHFKDRIQSVEQLIGACSSAEEHIQADCSSIGGRLDNLESLVSELTKDVMAAHRQLHDVNAAAIQGAKTADVEALQQRLSFIENDWREKNELAIEEVQKEVQKANVNVAQCASAVNLEVLDQRLGLLESKWCDVSEKHSRAIQVVDAIQGQVHDVHVKVTACDGLKEEMDHKLKDLETLLHGKLEAIGQTNEAYIENVQVLVEQLMKLMTDATASKNGDMSGIAVDLEQRFRTLQEEQKQTRKAMETQFEEQLEQERTRREQQQDLRLKSLQEDQRVARELMERSLRDQLELEHNRREATQARILEHCDIEHKSRQLYQEDFMQLLGQERSTRDSDWQQLYDRITVIEESFERKLATAMSNVKVVRSVSSRPSTRTSTPAGSLAAPAGLGAVPGSSSSRPMSRNARVIRSVSSRASTPAGSLSAPGGMPNAMSSSRTTSPAVVSRSLHVGMASAHYPAVHGYSAAHESVRVQSSPSAPPPATNHMFHEEEHADDPQVQGFASAPAPASPTGDSATSYSTATQIIQPAPPTLVGTLSAPQSPHYDGPVEPAHERVVARTAGSGSVSICMVPNARELGMMRNAAATVRAKRDEISSASSELENAIAAVSAKRSAIRSLSREIFGRQAHSGGMEQKLNRTLPDVEDSLA